MMTLYGCKGCGSSAIEAALQLLDVPFELVQWDWDDQAGWEKLGKINPLRQVPTLLLEDKTVLTESAAILLWLSDRHPDSGFVPPRSSGHYASFLRWLIFLTANIYTPIGIGDFPERWLAIESARANLKQGTIERSKASWLLFEEALEGSSFCAGSPIGFLNVYVAMLTRWRPGRAWIIEHCPAIARLVEETEAHPVVARVWKDNFP